MENSTNKTVKIVYLINQFYLHGGVQRMISNKIDAWIDQFGYEVTVITINQENKEIVYPPKNEFKFIDLGIKNANTHNLFLNHYYYKNQLPSHLYSHFYQPIHFGV